MKLQKDFAVCYSGGLDSTTVAFIMGRRYTGKVHLITVQHGHGHILPGLAKRHVRDLEQRLGKDRVTHHYAYTSQEFRQVVLRRVFQDYQKYGSNFVVCLGCNLAMDVHLIAYNLEHRVATSFVGFTPRGSNFAVMSLPETSRERRALHAHFGLLYRVPLIEWHMEKPEERDLLRQHGIWPGWNFRKIAMGVQPLCLLGVAMHHMDIFFDKHPQYDRSKVVEFIREKAPLVKELVGEMLAAKGIDVDERIAEMRALNADEWDQYGPDAPILSDTGERALTAELAGMPTIAARTFPNTVPLVQPEASMSRDGRPLVVPQPGPEPVLAAEASPGA